MTETKLAAALIIPAYNEEAVIGQMLDGIPPGVYALIVVAVNGSTDRTAEVARAHGAAVVSQAARGYGGACLQAIGSLPPEIEVVVFMQADNSELASEAHGLLAPITSGQADLVIGSRTLGAAAPGALMAHQKFGNALATMLIRWFWGHRYSDLGPYRAISVKKLKQLGMSDRNYGWTVEMQVRAIQRGLRIVEVPVTSGLRQAGENKVSGNWRASIMAGIKILWVISRLLVSGRSSN